MAILDKPLELIPFTHYEPRRAIQPLVIGIAETVYAFFGGNVAEKQMEVILEALGQVHLHLDLIEIESLFPITPFLRMYPKTNIPMGPTQTIILGRRNILCCRFCPRICMNNFTDLPTFTSYLL